VKASILAIGTELTTGQITNRNAAWISGKLADLGVETVLHETVADDRAMIRSALDRCRNVSRMIFVTGGLGPTTDDFTRDVIADWLGKPLEFHEPSWIKIQARLTRFGIPVAESNRQQCYYPEGAQVIVNDQGTADAFTTAFESGQLWVLPGPPREVEAVWDSAIEAQVRAQVPGLKPLHLLTWQCIGKSEAELGEITERALAGSGLPTGYRAHRPYVEVKVWCPQDLSAEEMRAKKTAIDALDRAIGPWVATRQGADLAARLLKLCARTEELEIADSLSGGILAERLGLLLREPSHAAQADSVIVTTEWLVPADPLSWVEQALSDADPTTITLAIAGFTDQGDWAFGLCQEGGAKRAESLRTPYRGAELLDRSRRYAVELALKRWSEWLESGVN
jgi:molybdenum cofactor synthesis domain-containing protein